MCCLANTATLGAQSSGFTYQGRLTANHAPANGLYDMRFFEFHSESGGSPSSEELVVPAVYVTNDLAAESVTIQFWNCVSEEIRDATFHFIAIGSR